MAVLSLQMMKNLQRLFALWQTMDLRKNMYLNMQEEIVG